METETNTEMKTNTELKMETDKNSYAKIKTQIQK